MDSEIGGLFAIILLVVLIFICGCIVATPNIDGANITVVSINSQYDTISVDDGKEIKTYISDKFTISKTQVGKKYHVSIRNKKIIEIIEELEK